MDIPVPLDSVDRVEVMRGSGSTMYGSDAVGGVINIITEPPQAIEFRLRTAVGNDGINQQRGSISDIVRRSCPSSSPSRAIFLPASCPTAIIATCSSPPSPTCATALRHQRPHPRLHGPPLRRRPVLRHLPLLGGHQDVVRRLQPGAGRKDQREFRLPPPQRSVRAVSRPTRRSTPITTPTKATRPPCGAARSCPPPPRCTTACEALHESIVSNNLGDHARSRAAAYAARRFPRAEALLALALRARRGLPQFLRARSAPPSPAASGSRRM